MKQKQTRSTLAGLLLIVAIAGADGARAAEAADVASPQRIAELVEQLGAADFAERQAAQEALEAIGPAAREALQAAVETGDAEVQLRARQVLKSFAADDFEQEMRQFVEDGTVPADRTMPGWAILLDAVGKDTKLARQFYADMYLGERRLFDAAAEARAVLDDPQSDEQAIAAARKRAGFLYQTRFDEAYAAYAKRVREVRLDPKRARELVEQNIAPLASFWLVRLMLPPDWTAEQVKSAASTLARGLVLGKQDRRGGWPPMAQWITSDSPRVAVAAPLFGAWVQHTHKPENFRLVLQTAMVLRQRATSVELARKIIERRDQVSDGTQFMAAHAMHLWGKGDEDIARTGKLLEADGALRLGGFKGGEPPRREMYVSEMALMALRRMANGKAADGDAVRVVTYCSAARWVPIFLYIDPAKRQARVEKWLERLEAEPDAAGDAPAAD